MANIAPMANVRFFCSSLPPCLHRSAFLGILLDIFLWFIICQLPHHFLSLHSKPSNYVIVINTEIEITNFEISVDGDETNFIVAIFHSHSGCFRVFPLETISSIVSSFSTDIT
jgi:hypothetical protein